MAHERIVLRGLTREEWGLGEGQLPRGVKTIGNTGLVKGKTNLDWIPGPDAQSPDQTAREGDGQGISRLDNFLIFHGLTMATSSPISMMRGWDRILIIKGSFRFRR